MIEYLLHFVLGLPWNTNSNKINSVHSQIKSNSVEKLFLGNTQTYLVYFFFFFFLYL